jgi:hypothetical protein
MKTLPAKLRFVVLGVIVLVVVVSCCNFPFLTDMYIELGHDVSGTRSTRTYVEWKDKGKFESALQKLHDDGGKICLCVLTDHKPHPHKLNNGCSSRYDCPSPPPIKTVKVTKSKAADRIAAEQSAVNDPNVTYRIQASALHPNDVSDVLATLQ